MRDKYFLDTNVFVYSFENAEKEKRKRKRSQALIKQALVKLIHLIFNLFQNCLGLKKLENIKLLGPGEVF